MLKQNIRAKKLPFAQLVESGGKIGNANWDQLRHMPFLLTARANQIPPANYDWRTWLFLGGRGAGKTRAGAEWVRYMALFGGARRLALVGPTISDVREVMIEGESGLKNLEWKHSPYDPPVYESSRRRLVFSNGAEAYAFSSEDPDSLRGPQFYGAWCDEIGAWRHAHETWDMLQFTLRLGSAPRCVATTTPRNTSLLRSLLFDAKEPSTGIIVSKGSTFENAEYLSKTFIDAMESRYAWRELGKQELYGEFLSEGSNNQLWTKQIIQRAQNLEIPDEFDEVVVAIDPPVTSGKNADACGIIVAGRWTYNGENRMAILSDQTVQGLPPLKWAKHACNVAESFGADLIVIETNQGGEMLELTLRTAGCKFPIRNVRAKSSKTDRAETALMHYSFGSVVHVHGLDKLEEQMLIFNTEDMRRSPDRVDAMVWAVLHLHNSAKNAPQMRWL